jgi:hypothetical protein
LTLNLTLMKPYIFCSLLLLSSIAFSQSNQLLISTPQNPWWWTGSGFKNANITNASMEITTKGTFAFCEFTYTTNIATGFFSNFDTLEARLFFNMPIGSYFFDSWLWLDSTTIIKAELLERNSANNIYLGIVKRQHDPSILLKYGDRYEFNIFPITNNYPRKVKLSYAIPINLKDGIIQFPVALTEMFSFLNSSADLSIILNKNNEMPNPTIEINNASAAQYLTSSNSNQSHYLFPSTITGSHFNLNVVSTQGAISTLNLYTINANEGYYEMLMHIDSVFPINNPPKKLNLIFNLVQSQNIKNNTNSALVIDSIYSDIKKTLISLIGEVDSFNLFYEKYDQVVNYYGTWVPLDSTHIANMFGGLNNINYGSHKHLDSLLMKGIAFTQQSEPQSGYSLIFSNDTSLMAINAQTAMYNHLNAYLGAIKNPIFVFNFSQFSSNSTSFWLRGNHLFWNKLTNNTNGVYISDWLTHCYTIANKYFYSTNMSFYKNYFLTGLTNATTDYNFDLPLSNGFKYSTYNTHDAKRKYTFGQSNFEIGKYYGTIDTSLGLGLQIKINNIWNNINIKHINFNPNETSQIKQKWTNLFLTYMIATNNQQYLQQPYKEIVDSSINNNVLCNYTAFLALDTGDTIKIVSNLNNGNVVGLLPPTPLAAPISVYPNPFNQNIFIESDEPILSININNLMGQKMIEKNNLHSSKVEIATTEAIWHAGLYLAIITTAKGTTVRKLVKY